MRLLTALVISDDLQPEHTEPTRRGVDAVVRPVAGRAQRSYYDFADGVTGGGPRSGRSRSSRLEQLDEAR